ncbi:MAG TPA: hypothetical protein VLK82_09545 [Candidatus Tectomicrobia bacterium]|nr:hypothetical protein [Candidatus Tectomicrobia bacterium]
MQAIVCIRKLRNPLPGRWQAPTGGVRAALDWQRAIAGTVDQLLRHAAHPGRGVVPDHAEAVVFADYGDMLACLANDWCAGEATIHWWWRSILRGQDSTGTVLRAWRESPEYVPAALQLLAGREQAVSFVRKLPTGEASTWVRGLTRRFALPELQAVLEARDQTRRGAGDTLPMTDRDRQFPSSSVDISPPDSPWRPWIPESAGRDLSLEHKCLLGIGLMLQRAPAVVRSAAFVLAVRRWHEGEQRSEEDSSHPLTVSRPLHEAPIGGSSSALAAGAAPAIEPWPPVVPPPEADRRQQATAAGVMTAGSESGHVSTAAPEVGRPRQSGLEEGLKGDSSRAAQEGRVAAATSELQRQREVTSDRSVHGHMRLDQQDPSVAPQPAGQGHERPSPQVGDSSAGPTLTDNRGARALDMVDFQIDTRLGGLFFLINLGLFLNLYGDFTTPAKPGIALPIWDFVALLGQKLVGEEVRADPVWGVLAHLSGRGEQVAPGAGFEPPDSWRMPVEWLAPFPEEAIWHWQGTDGRLQVKHPAQFFVLDVPLDPGDPARQLRCALQDYGTDQTVEPQPEAVAANAGGTALLERWLEWLMPYVRARLHRALQVPGGDELAQTLCRQRARVVVTATHVDILMALDGLPIEIRLAGLDRDPGWVPAAGRFIAFHFESALGVTSCVDESLC